MSALASARVDEIPSAIVARCRRALAPSRRDVR